jgi:kojibiose phosphorylase
MFQKLKKENIKLSNRVLKKIGLSDKEAAEWKKIAANIRININKKQVIEQFDGYFKKKKIKIAERDEILMMSASKKMTPREYDKTQLVKQADVIMLLYLLSDVFNLKTQKENYKYYIERTLHRSSLSLPVHAIMAISAKDRQRAYQFFHTALHTDISNINKNTDEGIHAGCMGGVWQVLVNGFAGVKIQKNTLSINPGLPEMWRKVLFSLNWRGTLLCLEIQNSKVKIRIVSAKKGKKTNIRIFGVIRHLAGKKIFVFKRKKPIKTKEAHYL